MKMRITAVLAALVVVGGFLYYQTKDRTRTPTSADNAPPGSIHNLPVPDAVAKARAMAAAELDTSEGLVIIQSAKEKEWPNSCLGLEKEGEFCLQVITPGYEVVLEGKGQTLIYRTNLSGELIRRDEAI